MTDPAFSQNPDLVTELDAATLREWAHDLGTTAEHVETLLREAIAAGLLSIAMTETDVVLRGEFPDLPADRLDDERNAR